MYHRRESRVENVFQTLSRACEAEAVSTKVKELQEKSVWLSLCGAYVRRSILTRKRVLFNRKAIIDRHIRALHEYNELKDIAQFLLGKLAQLEGVCTKDMYERFGLKFTD